ncbi:phytanoyl-CoA dioxygenase family protein [uncultured Hoeflea sp.]|uniref:phytanoyl-CoA dioxygenase family protein n=1 Tax=uncultured Hoeflea sp. TaxID=538666 RepID=UPI002633EE85|nr:phytanoyl-CoA dioxygenase family protein [uncultured Hoeflea sp.]
MTREHHHPNGYFAPEACDIDEFRTIIDQTTLERTVPNACDVQSKVPLYDMRDLRDPLEDPTRRRQIMAEWAKVLREGAGIVVLKGAYQETQVIDEATSAYEAIIKTEKDGNAGAGDHFAASGANDRIWNSLEKLCDRAPEVFLRYFANTPIAAVCEAWLGPNYQMTAQVNLVHPGGAAQLAHRDYHLGFQTADISAAYPAHVHDLSPVLTLQGAVAHCNMPVESGPTKLLPFSQTYRPGYTAWRRDDFRALFEERQIQLPLSKGDALFFNPATFHAAGANTSADIHRMANLLQVSSAFGRTMETIDRTQMCKALYPHALKARQSGALNRSELAAAIAATAEGYSFPTNLDRDPPVGGLAPETQQAYFLRALSENVGVAEFGAQLDLMDVKRLSC